MHLIITDAWLARSRAIHLKGVHLVVAMLGLSFVLMVIAVGLYHWVFLHGARQGWPVVAPLVRLLVKDEFDQRDRFMRENLDVLAQKLGEMQAKVVQLESLGERVSTLAGINPADLNAKPGRGGALVASHPLSLEELQLTLQDMDRVLGQREDLLTLEESRLFDQKIRKMMVPTQEPVTGAPMGSAFGWRVDPITHTSALHTGLDFQADPGTSIQAAAGGIVVTQEWHPAYGNMIEIDHGNQLITRYAHSSRVYVKKGDLVKRGQKIAEVGTTGRSTGPHLHFEVWIQGVPQDPRKFLDAGQQRVAAAPVTRPIASAAPAPSATAAPGLQSTPGQR